MRNRKGNGRGPDILFGYLIPMFFMGLAAYQEIANGAVDKYVIGGLFLFGLAALGYRVDVLLERWLIARGGGGTTASEGSSPPPSEDNSA